MSEMENVLQLKQNSRKTEKVLHQWDMATPGAPSTARHALWVVAMVLLEILRIREGK